MTMLHAMMSGKGEAVHITGGAHAGKEGVVVWTRQAERGIWHLVRVNGDGHFWVSAYNVATPLAVDAGGNGNGNGGSA